MALFDSADCYRRVGLRLNRPTTDEAFTVSTTGDVIYDFLSEAQDRITKLMAVYVPDALWTVPTATVTSDSGKTFTVGTDVDSATIFAMGHYRLYATRSAIPDNPLIPGLDFTVEGTLIRIPNNNSQVFGDGGTPWIQYAAPSNVLSASTQPTVPKLARPAMISDAARRCAERLREQSLADAQEAQFQSDWLEILAAIKTQADRKMSAGDGRSFHRTTGDLYWGGR